MSDIPKYYTAVAEWLAVANSILFWRRFTARKRAVIPVLAAGLLLLLVIQHLCGLVTNVLWLVGMAAAVLVMYLMLYLLLGTDRRATAYVTVRAFMIAEFIAALEWQLYSWCRLRLRIPFLSTPVAAALFYVTVYGLYFLIIYAIELRTLPGEQEVSFLSVTRNELTTVALIAAFFFAMSNLSYIQVPTPFTASGMTEIFNIRTLFDLSGVLVLHALHLQKLESGHLREMDAIRLVLANQYMQYKQSQENIDLINQKYHDLKHQLGVLRQEVSEETRIAAVDEIEKSIRGYETMYETGNSVLDTILTEKASQCQKYDITMTVVADGALLGHLYVMDLCTIFGNALSNAIEYLVQVEEVQNRLLHVSVTGRGQFVCIAVENWYQGDLKLRDGLPETTKGDKRYHGYGLRSVRYAVEKYKGHLVVSAGDGWFRLKILLPREDRPREEPPEEESPTKDSKK